MTKRIIWLFVLFSALFHFGSYWASYTIQIPLPSHPPQAPVEVELFEKKEEETPANRPALRFAEAPKELVDDSLEALKKKAEILSEKVQRVKKEMRANLFGLTKNRQPSPPKTPKGEFQKEIPNKPMEKNRGEDGLQIKATQRQSPEGNPLDMAPSTFGNQLDRKVDVGNFTALNTDRHLYYSFYARIEEMIRPPWEDQIIAEARIQSQNQLLVPKGGWSTRIDVILNPEGKLLKVVLLKASGIKGFDHAAIDAFQKAGFFPHPPKEMVGDDGTIILKYVFTVF